MFSNRCGNWVFSSAVGLGGHSKITRYTLHNVLIILFKDLFLEEEFITSLE